LEAIAEAIRERNEAHPDHEGKPEVNAQHGSHSLYDFCFTMQPGDLVIIGDGKRRRQVWEVVGGYEYAQPAAGPLNQWHHRQARKLDLNPNELWQRAGGELRAKINFRTLDQCAKGIGERAHDHCRSTGSRSGPAKRSR
jgi:hypothetical protein